MAQLQFPDKYPDEVIYYELDWAPAMLPDDTIVSATAVATSATVDTVQTVDTVTRVRVSGGTPTPFGGVIQFAAVTAKGETLGENVRLRVRAR